MDAKTIQANFEARSKAVSDLRALADEASGREFTGEERQTVERLEGAIAEYDGRISNGLRALEQDKSMAEARSKFDALTEGMGAEERAAVEADADSLRALAKGEKRAVEFRDVAKTGVPGQPDKPTLYRSLFEEAQDISTVMAGATILRTESGEDIVIPKAGAYGAATIVGEAAPIPESDPTFGGTVTLGAYKYAWMTDLSSEVVADAAFNLVAYLARTGGVSMGDGIGRHFLTGSGVGQPNGLVTASPVGKTLAGQAITGDEVIDLYHSLHQSARNRAKWVLNDSTAAALRKVKNSGGDYVWQESLRVDQPNTLLGRPVQTDVAMPALNGLSRRALLFADLNGYFARFSGPLRVERSTDFRFNTDQVTFRFIQRADGDLVDSKSSVVAVTPSV